MKQPIHYILYIAAIAMLSGCDDSGYIDDDWQPALDAHYVYMSASSLNLDSDEGSYGTETVYAENTAWQFDTPAEWLSVSPMNGSSDAEVSFKSKSANPSGEDIRTSVFALNSAVSEYEYSHPVSVTQAQSAPFLETYVDGNVSSGMFIDTGTHTTRTIDVSTNLKLTVTSDQDWCHATASADGKSLTVTVDDNQSKYSRSARLTVTTSSLTKVLEIVQAGANVSVSEESLQFGCSGGEYSITVTADMSWTATTTATSWLAISPSAGLAGSTNVTISAVDNMSTSARIGTIDFMMGNDKAVSVKVGQEGMTLSFTENRMSFDADKQSKTLELVKSNTEWWVTDKPMWISMSETSGQGDATLTITADEYWGTVPRTGTIELGCALPTLSCTMTVTQQPRTINAFESLSFDADAGSKSIEIDIKHEWTATPMGDASEWLNVTPSSASGSATLNVSVAENTTEAERTGIIRITAGDVTSDIAVSQRGKFFDVSPTAATLPQSGGTHSVTISTNDVWTATNGSSWMHLSATNGKGDIDLKLTADANKSTILRRDTTTITPAHTQPMRIITAQEGYYLRTDNTSLTLNDKGGRSNTVTITTNGTYTLEADYGGASQWFTITEEGTTFTIIADENKTETERTGKVIITLKDVLDNDPGRTLVIPVTQRYFSPGVNVEPFSPDQQWEISTNGSVTIRVTGFGEDKSLDDATKVVSDIPVEDYKEDSNWD